MVVSSDLREEESPRRLVASVIDRFGRIDALVNNASAYYATPVDGITAAQWDDLMGSNARAPLFLSQAAAGPLKKSNGAIVSILDIYAERPLPGHTVYCMAKAAHRMMIMSLARELGPEIRVNGVAPGNVLWSENPVKAETIKTVEERTALRRQGTPGDIAEAVEWLLRSNYITGQILSVDGGRSLFI